MDVFQLCNGLKFILCPHTEAKLIRGSRKNSPRYMTSVCAVQCDSRCGDGDMTSTKQLIREWAGAGAGQELQQMNLIMIINHPQTRRQPQPSRSPHPHTGTDTHCFLLNIQSPQKTSVYLGFDLIKYERRTLFELRTLQ